MDTFELILTVLIKKTTLGSKITTLLTNLFIIINHKIPKYPLAPSCVNQRGSSCYSTELSVTVPAYLFSEHIGGYFLAYSGRS